MAIAPITPSQYELVENLFMTSAPRPLIAGNWKMNSTRSGAVELATGLVDQTVAQGPLPCELLVCPPAHLLLPVLDVVKGTNVALGGQDCHAEPKGAHTGDVSAEMLMDVGCSFVIVGHSERRTNHEETDGMVCEKAMAAHRAGLIPIICVGETETQRDAGEALQTVGRQIADSLPDGVGSSNTVVAYEPVWAIGTGRTPTSQEIADVHAAMRNQLVARFGSDSDGLRLLYGGSVNPGNAEEIMSIDNVDGGLIGGASLKVETFWPIVQAFA
jgi:triosephosphate isomerase